MSFPDNTEAKGEPFEHLLGMAKSRPIIENFLNVGASDFCVGNIRKFRHHIETTEVEENCFFEANAVFKATSHFLDPLDTPVDGRGGGIGSFGIDRI